MATRGVLGEETCRSCQANFIDKLFSAMSSLQKVALLRKVWLFGFTRSASCDIKLASRLLGRPEAKLFHMKKRSHYLTVCWLHWMLSEVRRIWDFSKKKMLLERLARMESPHWELPSNAIDRSYWVLALTCPNPSPCLEIKFDVRETRLAANCFTSALP